MTDAKDNVRCSVGALSPRLRPFINVLLGKTGSKELALNKFQGRHDGDFALPYVRALNREKNHVMAGRSKAIA